MDLFSETDVQSSRKFQDHLAVGDTKGAINYLYGIPIDDGVEEVLRAGFNTIGPINGKNEFINHVAEQIVKN